MRDYRITVYRHDESCPGYPHCNHCVECGRWGMAIEEMATPRICRRCDEGEEQGGEMESKPRGYDSRCYDLAVVFLEDEYITWPPGAAEELAQEIQDTIETFLAGWDPKPEAK